MGILSQDEMNRLFDVIDELGVDREEVVVPLLTVAEGAVGRRGKKLEITLPEADLEAFLQRLPELLNDARS